MAKYDANQKQAKDRIKRERNADRQKFDRIMDRAKIRDAKVAAQQSKPARVTEGAMSHLDPKLDRMIDRMINRKGYRQAIRYYLDYRRQNPGKAMQNAVKVSKMTGADFRNLEYMVHKMINQSKLPPHLAWREDLLDKKRIKAQLAKKAAKLKESINEASKVPAGMKFIASYVYKDAKGNDHTHRHLRKGTKMTDPVVVYIDGKEWKTFQSFTKAKQAAINHIKTLKEDRVAQDPDVKDKKGTQPKKYYSGLSKSTKDKRDAHFKKKAKMDDDNPDAYTPAPGDKDAKTKPSKHTNKYKQMYGEALTMREYMAENATAALKKKAEKSGMPLSVLRQVYNRGVAAWRTGHRPGTTPQQWGLARVNSFVTKSSGTWGKADSDLAAKVRGKK